MTTRRPPRRKARGVRRTIGAAAGPPVARPTARPVLVATDGGRPASAAVRFAHLMAERGLWAPEVLTVMDPIPVPISEFALAMPGPEIQEALTEGVLARIRRQLKRAGGETWHLDVEFGRVASTIAHTADEHDVNLVVIGLGHHGKQTRVTGAETAARLTRLSHMPVLAVDAAARALPRVALVAMDFGDSSVAAAREVMTLLEPPARMHMLHVRWAMNGRTIGDPEWERSYAAGVEQGFRRVRGELGTRTGVEITCEMRLGAVVETTLAVAKEIGAQVLAAGSHNESMLDRLLIGSTPAQLLRAARCSVLIAPPGESA